MGVTNGLPHDGLQLLHRSRKGSGRSEKVKKGAVFVGANRRMDNVGREWRRTGRIELSCEVEQVECK